MKKTLNYLLMLLCVSLVACNMPLSDDYVQPIEFDENVPISAAFNLDYENGVLMLGGYDGYVIPYSFSAHGREIVAIEMTLGNKVWELIQPTSELYVYADELPEGNYTLNCNIAIKSGTGSLADQLDGEFYIGSFSFPVCVDKSYQPKKRLRQSINKDGLLTLEWDSPASGHAEIEEYTLYATDSYGSESITFPANTTSYVDLDYAGQKKDYTLQAHLKDKFSDKRFSWLVDRHEIESQISLLSQRLADGTILVIWQNPFQCNVNVEDMATLPDAEIINGYLSFKPVPSKDNYWDAMQTVSLNFSKPGVNTWFQREVIEVPLYTMDLTQQYHSEFFYNSTEKVLYATFQNELISYKEENYREIARKEIGTYYTAKFCTSPNSSLVAAYIPTVNGQSGNDYLVVYKDSSLEELWRKPCLDKPTWGSSGQAIFLTTDNRLVYFTNRNSGKYVIVLNALTGDKETEFMLEGNSFIYEMAISPDGKKVCFSEAHYVYLLDLENYQVTAKHTLIENDYLRYCFFNENRPNEIGTICSGNMNYTYWDMTTREVIRTVPELNSTGFQGVDIHTGNLLLGNYPKLYVVSGEDGTILYETYTNSTTVALVNNHLTSISGLVMNLNKLMTK